MRRPALLCVAFTVLGCSERVKDYVPRLAEKLAPARASIAAARKNLPPSPVNEALGAAFEPRARLGQDGSGNVQLVALTPTHESGNELQIRLPNTLALWLSLTDPSRTLNAAELDEKVTEQMRSAGDQALAAKYAVLYRFVEGGAIEAFVIELGAGKVLGTVVAWAAPGDPVDAHDALLSALARAGVEVDVASARDPSKKITVVE